MRRLEHHEVRGLRLAWHEWGPVDAPIVLCIHGFMDHGRSFTWLAEQVDRELRVVAPDMRGHGESGWVGAGGYYHFYDYFHDVHRLHTRLGEPPILLVGHSMGGSIASGVAAILGAAVRGLVLLEGMGPRFSRLGETRDRVARWTVALDQPGVAADVEGRRAARQAMPDRADAAQRLRRANPRLSPERGLALAESFTEPAPGGLVWRFDPLHRTPAVKPFVSEEAEALWRAITAPTLSLFGEHGTVPADLERRHQQIQGLVAGWVPGAGHNLHHERPEVVAAAVLALHHTGRATLPAGAVPGLPP